MRIADKGPGLKYELRRGRLHVSGERQAVSPDTILAAMALFRAEAKDPLDVGLEDSFEIPEDLALLILRMEARKAAIGLGQELAGVLAA